MKVYYITIFLVFILSTFAQYRQRALVPAHLGASAEYGDWKTKNLFVLVAAAVLIFTSGFRYWVGTDFGAYYYQSSVSKYIERLGVRTLYEPGTGVLAWVASLFYSGDGSLTFAAALVTISLYVRTISKYSSWFLISMLLFIFAGAWHGSFNGVRQYLAAAVLFAGHRFILDRKLGKWLAVVVIAGLFHTTAYAMVFWYFVATRKLDGKQIILVLGIALIGLFSYDRVFDLVELYKDTEMNLQNPYLISEVNRLRILVHWVPFIFFLFTRRYLKMTKETNFYLNMVFLDAALMTAAMNSTYFGRVGIYTGYFQLIAWPIMLKALVPRDRRVVAALMILLYGIYWYVEVSGGSALRNFRWVFGR